jgi:hypothetical protein
VSAAVVHDILRSWDINGKAPNEIRRKGNHSRKKAGNHRNNFNLMLRLEKYWERVKAITIPVLLLNVTRR